MEKVEKILQPLVASLITLIQNGVDFVKGQIPDVALQILKFKAAEAWLQIGTWTLVGLIGILLLGFALKVIEKRGEDTPFPVIIRAIVGGLMTIVYLMGGIASTYESITTLLKIHYAPKLFLLEFLKEILK